MQEGRITASKFKSVCHPDMVLFKTAAISWGCQHEKDALEMYERHQCIVNSVTPHLVSSSVVNILILGLLQMELFAVLVVGLEYVK